MKISCLILMYCWMLPTYSPICSEAFEHIGTENNEVRGRILSAENKQPVSKAHVYASKGEVECFSNEKGYFKLASATEKIQVIFIEHPEYKIYMLEKPDATKNHELLLVPNKAYQKKFDKFKNSSKKN